MRPIFPSTPRQNLKLTWRSKRAVISCGKTGGRTSAHNVKRTAKGRRTFMDHIEQALSDLLKQFAELKQEFTKLQKMRGIPGPRGPAGEIDAAVNNARDVAELVAITAAKAAVVYPFQNEVKQVRAEFQ